MLSRSALVGRGRIRQNLFVANDLTQKTQINVVRHTNKQPARARGNGLTDLTHDIRELRLVIEAGAARYPRRRFF